MQRSTSFAAAAVLAIAIVAAAACAPVTRVYIEFREPPSPSPAATMPAPTQEPTPAPTASPGPPVTPAPTPEPVTPAPVVTPVPLSVSGIEVLDVTDTTARITWTCSEPANAWMEWGAEGVVVPNESYPETNYPGETSLDYATHIQVITGLTPETTYHFRVFCMVPDPVSPLIASAVVR